MTVIEAARRLEISEKVVRRLCQLGRLPHRRIGTGRGVIRITEADLAEYLEACRVGIREPAPAVRAGGVARPLRVRAGKDHFA